MWRNSLDLLIIVLVLFIHPTISIPFGILAKALKFCQKDACKKSTKQNSDSNQRKNTSCLKRMFTVSIYLYFAFIGAMIHYLHQRSVDYRASGNPVKTKFDYTNKKFEQCDCRGEESKMTDFCNNTLEDFSNDFIHFSQFHWTILISLFIVSSLTIHLVLSLCKKLPPPTPLLDFIVGRCEADEAIPSANEENPEDGIHLQEPGTEQVPLEPQKTKPSKKKKLSFKIICFILAIFYLIALFLMPAFYNLYFQEASLDIKPGKQPFCFSKDTNN